jgi:molybdate transport system ATP-binding protein
VFLAGVHADRGALTTLWISATDVMISLTAPQGISALNVLPVQVVAVQDASATEVILSLAMGSEQILARITKRSFVALNLTPGLLVFAVLKSVAMAAGQVHRPGQGPDI